jgi:hypothetical protein
MSINQSQFNKSRLDKFLMVIDLPPALKPINTTDFELRSNTTINSDSLQFSVYGTVVPPINVPASSQLYAGQSFKVSTHVRPPYEDVSVNFTVDSNFNNYWVIYKWLDLLNDDKASIYNYNNPAQSSVNRKNISPAAYQTDITLYAKNEFDVNIVKFVYKYAFPVKLGQINYNYRDEKEIETTFDFAYAQLLVEIL